MKMFRLNFETLLLRYYLMMAAVIIAGFVGNWWLALIALPIFLTCLAGVRFGKGRSEYEEFRTEPRTKSLQRTEEAAPVQNAA